MILALFSPLGLAALAPASPAPAGAGGEAPPIHDIAPPIDVFPYPPWMVAIAVAVVLAILGLAIWGIARWLRSRPAPPPPGPTTIALRELEKLRARAGELDPYAFSFAVSDVLRTFISNARFRLPATQQTSPELLAAISGSPLFGESDRALLGRFLEKCDMIKFARIQATSEDNLELVKSAHAFVQGGQA